MQTENPFWPDEKEKDTQADLKPLFDRHIQHVGWLYQGKYLYDTYMKWLAYVADGHAWSARTGSWCGPVNGTECIDQKGKVVAWNSPKDVAGSSLPARPPRAARAPRPRRVSRPPRPTRPAQPTYPANGWSNLSFMAWLGERDEDYD